MVGIVLVSHSEKIVEGIIDLCMEMMQSKIALVNAAGTSEGKIGTDAMKIHSAIVEADSGDGVVLLADIGSAVMSTQMAMDFLDEAEKERVILADAPLVEGSIAACVQASIGSELEDVVKSAEQARNYSKK